MEVDGGNAVLVGVDDVLDEWDILHVGGAFVVDDHIVTLRPIFVLVGWELVSRPLVVSVHNVDHDVGTLLEARLQNVLLFSVFMTAAANDQKRLERLWRGLVLGG